MSPELPPPIAAARPQAAHPAHRRPGGGRRSRCSGASSRSPAAASPSCSSCRPSSWAPPGRALAGADHRGHRRGERLRGDAPGRIPDDPDEPAGVGRAGLCRGGGRPDLPGRRLYAAPRRASSAEDAPAHGRGRRGGGSSRSTSRTTPLRLLGLAAHRQGADRGAGPPSPPGCACCTLRRGRGAPCSRPPAELRTEIEHRVLLPTGETRWVMTRIRGEGVGDRTAARPRRDGRHHASQGSG